MRLPVQVVLCVLLSILIQQDRMKGNAKPTAIPLKEDPEFHDLTNSQKDVKSENASNLQLIWKVLLRIVDNLSKTKKSVSENKQNIEEVKDTLQGEIDGVQGDITNVKGDITNIQGDIVDMQNANSALCAYQNLVGQGDNGLSGRIVVYGTTYLETNGASCSLDKGTGKFTAGKSGVYQISVSAQYGHTNGRYNFHVYLRTSSGKYQDTKDELRIAYQYFDGEPYIKTPLNAIRFISLQQGETAWLEYSCTGGPTSTDCRIEDLKFCVSLYK